MLQLAGIAIDAVSVGGLETCIQLPGQKLAFDIGRCPRSAVYRPTVAFTHAHMDHMGGVAFHCATRSLLGLDPPTYLVPHKNVKAFEALFHAWRQLDRSGLRHELVPIGPGESYRLPSGLVAKPFRSPHRVFCQGYVLWEEKQKLKPELVGTPGRQLADMKREGVEITDTISSPVFAFTGDTKIEVLEQEEAVRKARVLVLECTFVDDRVSVKQCRSKGHVHLYEIRDRAELFENQQILLTHFSARYRASDIVKALDKQLPPDLRARVTPLLKGHDAVAQALV